MVRIVVPLAVMSLAVAGSVAAVPRDEERGYLGFNDLRDTRALTCGRETPLGAACFTMAPTERAVDITVVDGSGLPVAWAVTFFPPDGSTDPRIPTCERTKTISNAPVGSVLEVHVLNAGTSALACRPSLSTGGTQGHILVRFS